MSRHRPLRGALALALGLSTLGAAHGQSIFSLGKVSSILTGTDGLPFRMAEGSIWLEDTDSGVEGSSLRSGPTGDRGVSSFELPFVPGGQTVTWSVKVSSEQNYDYFRFYVNGTEVDALRRSGTVDWTELSHVLPPLSGGTPVNILAPGDAISASSANSLAVEPVENLLDGNPATIYRNFDKQNVAITVTPQSGRSIVTGLRLATRDFLAQQEPPSSPLVRQDRGLEVDLYGSRF